MPSRLGKRVENTTSKVWRWPDDFVSLDEGRLYVRTDFVPVFEDLGWTTLQAILDTDQCQVIRRVAERDNCRVQLPCPSDIFCSEDHSGSRKTVRAYLKRHRSRSIGDWLLTRLLGREWVPPGRAEADAVGVCQQAGVSTMSVIAAGGRIGRFPWQADSIFLSEEIAAAVAADDFWKERIGNPESSGVSPNRRRALLAALAETARRFHAAGLFHRDFYWCHFFVRETAPGRFDAHLIDLQRVLHCNRFRTRWLLKDLAQFFFSVPDGCLSKEELRRWFERYRQVPELSWFDLFCYWMIDLRARLYRWKEGRR